MGTVAPLVPIAAALAAILSLGVSRPLAAQIPGSELGDGSRARSEYLEAVFGEVKLILEEWRDALHKGDMKRVRQMFTDDGLFSPAEGWYVQGREAVVDSLNSRGARVKGYHAALIDFTASGGLAYYLGRVSYQIDTAGGARSVAGTFVMVLYQSGRRWKIRSYIERDGSSN